MIDLHLTLLIKRPVDDVLGYVGDVENLPRWADVVRSARLVDRDGDGTSATFEVEMQFLGRHASARYIASANRAERTLTVRTVSGPVELVNRYRFDPVAEGTRLTVTSEGHAPGVSRLLEPVIRGAVRRQFEADHVRLKRTLEADDQSPG